MRKLVTTLAAAGVLGLGAASGANAAPVPGFEALYTAVVTNCTLPAGTLPLCESAITAYSGALVGAVDLAVANQSISELRSEVFTANAPATPDNAVEVKWQKDVDDLFELLLPDSGAIGGGGAAAAEETSGSSLATVGGTTRIPASDS